MHISIYSNSLRFFMILAFSAMLALASCGEDPQTQMQQAQIALSNNKPDLALDYATSVLDAQPGNNDAMMVKARAQVMLARLDDAKKSLDHIIKIHPNNIDSRELHVTWAFRKLHQLLSQTNFVKEEKLQQRFDEVLKMGREEAEWLSQRGHSPAEVAFTRAKFAEMDARRYKTLLTTESRSISRLDTTIDGDQESEDEVKNRYERLIENQVNDVERLLRQAIEADPQHFAAARMYVGVLIQRQRWREIWDLAEKMAGQEELPGSLAGDLIAGLQNIPVTNQPKGARLELGWKVLSAVDNTQQKSRAWQLAAARLHMDAGDWADAKRLLDEVIKKSPADVEARYFLASALFYEKEHAQAREVLEKLRKRPPNRYIASRIESLYGRVMMELEDDPILAKEALARAKELDPNNDEAHIAFMDLVVRQGQAGDMPDVEEYYHRNPSKPMAIRLMLQHLATGGNRQAVAEMLDKVEYLSPITDDHVAILIDGHDYLKNYDKSLRYARQLVRRQPNAVSSHMRLAAALLRKGEDKQAKQMLEEIKQKFPDQVASVDQVLGQLYLRQGYFDRAIDTLEAVVEEKPADIGARLQLARAYIGLSMLEESLEQVNEILEIDPDQVDAHALAARIYQAKGQREKSEEHLDQIDETNLNERSNPLVVAQLKIKKKDYNGAILTCNRAIGDGNNDPDLRILLARVYLQQNSPREAEDALRSLIQIQPDHLRAYIMLSQIFIRQKEIDRGLNELVNLQVVNEPFSRLAQAGLLMASGKPKEALARLDPVYEPLIRNRDDRALRIADAMARIHAAQGDLEAAVAVFDPLVEEGIRTNEIELRRIGLLSRQRSVDETLASLDALSKMLTPDQRSLRFQVLRWYLSLNRYDRALAFLDRWLEELSDHPTLLRWKGDVLTKMGQYAEAIEIYKRGTQLVPESLPMWFSLARAYELNLDYTNAEQVLRQASKIDAAARIVALASLGKLFVNLGLHRQATVTFEELERSARPRDPRVLLAMGQAYLALRQDDMAREKLELIPEYAPQYPAAQVILGRIEQQSGMVEAAKARLETLARNRRYVAAVIREMIALKLRHSTHDDLVRWSDKALSLERLPDAMKLQWFSIRLALNADDRDWAAASQTLEQMIQIAPDRLQLVAARVAVLLRLNQVEKARSLYRVYADQFAETEVGNLYALALKEPKSKDKAYQGISGFLEALIDGDLDAARSAAESFPPRKTIYEKDLIDVLDRPDIQSPGLVESCTHLGLAIAALDYFGLPQLAEDFCRDVIGRQASFPLAYTLLVHALLDQNKPVIETLSDARKAMPNSMLTMYLSARDNIVNEDYEAAADDYLLLLENESDNYHIRYALGQAYHAAGLTQKAISVLEMIVNDEDSPYRIVASNDLAYLLAENAPDKLDRAYSLAKQAFEDAPNLAALLDTLGWIEHLRGHDEQAISHLNRAVKTLNDLPSVHYHLGIVYRNLNNTDWARYHFQAAAESRKDEPDVDKAAKALEAMESS